MNDDSCGTYNSNSQIKLKSSLRDYSDAYIRLKGTITLSGQGAHTTAVQADINNEQVIFKNSAPFTDCITEINNTNR